MKYGELLLKGASAVKNSAELTFYFKEAYRNINGSYPSCGGCSIQHEFQKLVDAIQARGLKEQEIPINQKEKIKMAALANSKKTFKLKPTQQSILTYVNQEDLVRRKFIDKVDDAFVIEYLTNGTAEEIEKRKALFYVLPEDYQETKAQEDKVQNDSRKGVIQKTKDVKTK